MFGFLRRKQTVDVGMVSNALSSAFNAYGTMTWKELFGNYKISELKGDRGQLGLSAIFCAVNLYAGALISLPRLTQRIDSATGLPIRYVKTTEHPAARIWSHYASEEMYSDELLKLMVYDILFYDGNFYALPEYDQQGRISRAYYVHPTRVPRGSIYRATGDERLTSGRKARRGEIIYNISAETGETRLGDQSLHFTVAQDEIIHMKGMIPDSDYFRSQGVMENNARSAGLYDSSEEASSYFYRRGHTNQMFLSTDQKLSATLKKEMEAIFNGDERNKGLALEDVFKTRILEAGLKPVNVGITPEVMRFIETRAFAVEDVGRWFNIPPGLLHSLMGTGGAPDYEKQMIAWIQGGLGQFMTNIEKQFKYNFLPRASQPLFSFTFDRLHLYKSVINEFSQALRNFFEIGVVNRVVVANLIGTHVDATDNTNTQRHTPANILTVGHSKSIEQKAKKSLAVMDEQIAQMQQDREQGKKAFKMQMEAAAATPAPGSAPGGTPPSPAGKSPAPATKVEKGQGDPKPNKSTSGAPPKGSTKPPPGPNNIVRTALYNTLHGLHKYEARILEQKKKSRPDDLQNAMEEWYPRFQETVQETLSPWEPVLKDLLTNLSSSKSVPDISGHDSTTNPFTTINLDEVDNYTQLIIDTWISISRNNLDISLTSESLADQFESLFSFIKDNSDADSGIES
jgi:HK97 family phage portal protein